MKVLEVENLIRNYRRSSLKKSEEDVKVLKGLNFAVEEGEFVGIMGKSGCGKTTLLKVLGMILGREKESVMTKAAQEYAEKFLISHLVKKNPYELSGGEKQRVAICRALINDPDLVLADEPTGNLDSKSGKIVIDALPQIIREFKKTIVMVTHDPQMASYCSRIILLKDGLILDTLKRRESQEAFYQEIIGRMAEL